MDDAVAADNCKILSDLFEAAVMYSLGVYEVNLSPDEFIKKSNILLHDLQHYSFVEDRTWTISIVGSGNWDNLNWHNIKINNYTFAILSTVPLS